jgi:hypothetical protein
VRAGSLAHAITGLRGIRGHWNAWCGIQGLWHRWRQAFGGCIVVVYRTNRSSCKQSGYCGQSLWRTLCFSGSLGWPKKGISSTLVHDRVSPSPLTCHAASTGFYSRCTPHQVVHRGKKKLLLMPLSSPLSDLPCGVDRDGEADAVRVLELHGVDPHHLPVQVHCPRQQRGTWWRFGGVRERLTRPRHKALF